MMEAHRQVEIGAGPAAASGEPGRRPWHRGVAAVIAAATIAVAFAAMRRHAVLWNLPQVADGLRHESLWTLAAAAAFTLASFAALGAYDVLGCSVVVPGRVRWTTALFAGAAANAISNTLGFHALTGTALRLRIYRRVGIPAGDTLRVAALSWLGIGLGIAALFTLGGFGQAWSGSGLAGFASWPSVALGLAMTAVVLWLSSDGRTVRMGGFHLALPSSWTALRLIALGAVENGAAIAALYVLLPPGSAPPFVAFAASYVAAVALGVASQVPGGLGVFEAALMSIWAGRIGSELPVALVVYRLVYNVLPFTLSTVALAAWELAGARAYRARLQFEGG